MFINLTTDISEEVRKEILADDFFWFFSYSTLKLFPDGTEYKKYEIGRTSNGRKLEFNRLLPKNEVNSILRQFSIESSFFRDDIIDCFQMTNVDLDETFSFRGKSIVYDLEPRDYSIFVYTPNLDEIKSEEIGGIGEKIVAVFLSGGKCRIYIPMMRETYFEFLKGLKEKKLNEKVQESLDSELLKYTILEELK